MFHLLNSLLVLLLFLFFFFSANQAVLYLKFALKLIFSLGYCRFDSIKMNDCIFLTSSKNLSGIFYFVKVKNKINENLLNLSSFIFITANAFVIYSYVRQQFLFFFLLVKIPFSVHVSTL